MYQHIIIHSGWSLAWTFMKKRVKKSCGRTYSVPNIYRDFNKKTVVWFNFYHVSFERFPPLKGLINYDRLISAYKYFPYCYKSNKGERIIHLKYNTSCTHWLNSCRQHKIEVSFSPSLKPMAILSLEDFMVVIVKIWIYEMNALHCQRENILGDGRFILLILY